MEITQRFTNKWLIKLYVDIQWSYSEVIINNAIALFGLIRKDIQG